SQNPEDLPGLHVQIDLVDGAEIAEDLGKAPGVHCHIGGTGGGVHGHSRSFRWWISYICTVHGPGFMTTSWCFRRLSPWFHNTCTRALLLSVLGPDCAHQVYELCVDLRCTDCHPDALVIEQTHGERGQFSGDASGLAPGRYPHKVTF